MEGGWYFVDEAEDFGGGPYLTEKEAIEQLNQYVTWLHKGLFPNESIRTSDQDAGNSVTGDATDSSKKI